MTFDNLMLRLAVSLAIGLLIGLERAWHQREDQDRRAAGIRTFALSGLIGGLSGLLGQSLGAGFVGLAFLAYAAVFAGFEAHEAIATKSFGATSAVAGLAVFLLGALAAVGDVQVAVAAGITTAAILTFREMLHGLVARLTWVEIRDGVILLAMAFLMLPILPDRSLDPWDSLNLRQLWIIATLIAAVSFASWLAIRGFGERRGILLVSALGGLTSSTATTAGLARMARAPGAQARLLSAGMCVSGVVSLLRIAALSAVLRPPLLATLALPFIAASASLVAAGLWFLRQGGANARAEGFELKSPLDLVGALRMAALFAAVSLVAGLLRAEFGAAGFYVVSAVSGLVDLDAITVTAARLGGMDRVAAHGILIATGVNLGVKAGLAASLGSAETARAFVPATVLAILAGLAAALLMP